jgi:hypothetical protein
MGLSFDNEDIPTNRSERPCHGESHHASPNDDTVCPLHALPFLNKKIQRPGRG